MTTEEKLKKAELLVQFINATKDGMVKPYDPYYFVEKIKKIGDQYGDGFVDKFGANLYCCPTSMEIRDSIDFKDYTLAAVREFAELMDLQIQERNYDRRKY